MADMVLMPKLGFDMAEGTLVKWLIKEDETVSSKDVIAEIETDKATVEVECGFNGIVRKLMVDQGTTIPVNTPIAIIGKLDEVIQSTSGDNHGKQGEDEIETKKPISEINSKEIKESINIDVVVSRLKISPLARKMIKENGLPMKSLQGSGPGGRIIRKDIEKYLEVTKDDQPEILHEDTTKPMSKLRQVIGRRLTESKQQIPHFYVTRAIIMDQVIELKKQLAELPNGDGKTSINDFVVLAVARALRGYPNLNGSVKDDSIIHHEFINIGVAVAVEGGLLTVVCKDADKKGLLEISKEIKLMLERARNGKVRPEDIEGSTFSISNLGMYDVDEFSAIINPPEAAILAVGSIQQLPIVENEGIKIRSTMKVTISADHRISDGAEAARFLQELAKNLEEPIRLLFSQD